MKILVTGGTGYIGSHTCIELINNGYEVIIIDNFYNSNIEVLNRIQKITTKTITFYQTDLLNKESIEKIFHQHDITAVIHFAGYKAVGESVHKPLEYYNNNITGTLNLCDVMRKNDVKNLIFSSSATVYGEAAQIPITENVQKVRPQIRMAGQNGC